MNEVKFSVELVNAILQYLGSRPFVEVAGLITEIQKQANVSKPEEKTQAEE